MYRICIGFIWKNKSILNTEIFLYLFNYPYSFCTDVKYHKFSNEGALHTIRAYLKSRARAFQFGIYPYFLYIGILIYHGLIQSSDFLDQRLQPILRIWKEGTRPCWRINSTSICVKLKIYQWKNYFLPVTKWYNLESDMQMNLASCMSKGLLNLTANRASRRRQIL